MIDNPDYIPDPNLYLYDDIGAIGIEIWQVNSSTIYDNIIITDSIEEAMVMFKKNEIEKDNNIMLQIFSDSSMEAIGEIHSVHNVSITNFKRKIFRTNIISMHFR